jgi:DNA polymerase-3 subunit chi
MTRIDFYQVNGDQRLFTCRLIDKVYRRGHHVYIHTMDDAEAAKLDEDLWLFRPDSFIPHGLCDQIAGVPVVIGYDHEPDQHHDVLINLSGSIPTFFSRFERVAEVVPEVQTLREAARANYTFYKERGYALEYHKVNQAG